MTEQCKCNYCERHRRLHEIIGKLDDIDANFLYEYEEESEQARMDSAYYGSIVRGEWPNAVEVLSFALDRARIKEIAQ